MIGQAGQTQKTPEPPQIYAALAGRNPSPPTQCTARGDLGSNGARLTSVHVTHGRLWGCHLDRPSVGRKGRKSALLNHTPGRYPGLAYWPERKVGPQRLRSHGPVRSWLSGSTKPPSEPPGGPNDVTAPGPSVRTAWNPQTGPFRGKDVKATDVAYSRSGTLSPLPSANNRFAKKRLSGPTSLLAAAIPGPRVVIVTLFSHAALCELTVDEGVTDVVPRYYCPKSEPGQADSEVKPTHLAALLMVCGDWSTLLDAALLFEGFRQSAKPSRILWLQRDVSRKVMEPFDTPASGRGRSRPKRLLQTTGSTIPLAAPPRLKDGGTRSVPPTAAEFSLAPPPVVHRAPVVWACNIGWDNSYL